MTTERRFVAAVNPTPSSFAVAGGWSAVVCVLMTMDLRSLSLLATASDLVLGGFETDPAKVSDCMVGGSGNYAGHLRSLTVGGDGEIIKAELEGDWPQPPELEDEISQQNPELRGSEARARSVAPGSSSGASINIVYADRARKAIGSQRQSKFFQAEAMLPGGLS